MREGWPDKEAATILRVKVTKVSQSLNPALEKMARLWRADPHRTMLALFEALDRLNKLDPISDAELDLRERIAAGRADRSELHR